MTERKSASIGMTRSAMTLIYPIFSSLIVPASLLKVNFWLGNLNDSLETPFFLNFGRPNFFLRFLLKNCFFSSIKSRSFCCSVAADTSFRKANSALSLRILEDNYAFLSKVIKLAKHFTEDAVGKTNGLNSSRCL